MATDTPQAPPFPPGSTAVEGEAWKIDKQGREYTNMGTGRPGPVYRRGDETIEQARERAARGPSERPRKRAKPKVPDAPRAPDLKELERILTEALKQPGLLAAAFGDEWAADHFVRMAPAVSRNLVVASEHNPWLRRKLEDAATGQDAAMAVLSLVPLAGAVFMYIAPPLIYFFDLPVSERGRQMLGDIPRRSEQRPAPSATMTPTPPQDGNSQPPQPFAPAGTAGPPPVHATAAESTESSSNSAPPAGTV